jgi:hypothetical protein
MPRRKKSPVAEQPAKRAEHTETEIEREVADDFQERQNMNVEGSEALGRELREHNALSPELSADDIDAAWQLARESGEETLAGHAPTPDQDRVDDIGAAAGLTYKDAEPLQYGKVSRRDERRWELDPRSGQAEQAMDEEDDEEDEDDAADSPDAPLRFWDLADDLDAEVEELDEEDDDDDEDDEDDEEEDDAVAVVDDELEADEVDADEDEEDELEDELDTDDELDEDLDDLEEDDLDDDEDD